jgi:hypothetical protein
MFDHDGGDHITSHNTTTMSMKMSPWNVLLPWLFLWHSASPTRVAAFAPAAKIDVPFMQKRSPSMPYPFQLQSTTASSAHAIQVLDFTNEPSRNEARANVQALKDLPRPTVNGPAKVICGLPRRWECARHRPSAWRWKDWPTHHQSHSFGSGRRAISGYHGVGLVGE